jgi:transposase InsO family protein
MNIHSLAKTCPQSRLLLVERIQLQQWTAAEAAEAAGISRRTMYKWLARYRTEGASGLLDRPSRPHRSPRRTAKARVDLVVSLRRCRMTGRQIARRLRMSPATVARILVRAGLSRMRDLVAPEPVRRYQRRRPGELLHVDIKKLGKIGRIGHRIHGDRRATVEGIGWEYVHVCIDDASRVAYVEVLENELGITCEGFLRRAVAWYRERGIHVRQVMSDNGGGYVSKVFRRAIDHLRVDHIRTRPYRPQTNGKAERFIQTLLREWAYERPYKKSAHRRQRLHGWLRHYNEVRPHGSLAGKPPISRLELAA